MTTNRRSKVVSGLALLAVALLTLVSTRNLHHRPTGGIDPAPAPEFRTSLVVSDPLEAGSPDAPALLFPVSTSPSEVTVPPGNQGESPISYVPDLPPEALEIAATGDVNLGGTMARVIDRNGPDYPWRRVSDLLSGADITVINLECAVSTRGSPFPKQFNFRADPSSVASVRQAGVDVLSVANNHSLDYGAEALLDTVSNVAAGGMTAIGAGSNLDEAWTPHFVTAKGMTVAFIAASRVIPHESWAATETSPGMATAYDDRRLLSEVRRAAAVADVVVVSIHWGSEGKTQPEPHQVSLGHQLVDAGASVVLGHHPHVLQPVVRYRSGIIAYSLGNFVFTSRAKVQQSMLLRIGILPTGELTAAHVPIHIVGGQPRPA